MYSFTLSRCGLSTCIKVLIDWLIEFICNATEHHFSKVRRDYCERVLYSTEEWRKQFYRTLEGRAAPRVRKRQMDNKVSGDVSDLIKLDEWIDVNDAACPTFVTIDLSRIPNFDPPAADVCILSGVCAVRSQPYANGSMKRVKWPTTTDQIGRCNNWWKLTVAREWRKYWHAESKLMMYKINKITTIPCWLFSWRLPLSSQNFRFLKVFSIHSHLSLPQADLLESWMTTHCLAVTGGGSIGKCGRLSQPNCLSVRTILVILTYILTILAAMLVPPRKDWPKIYLLPRNQCSSGRKHQPVILAATKWLQYNGNIAFVSRLHWYDGRSCNQISSN